MTALLLHEFRGYDFDCFLEFVQMDTDYLIFLPRYYTAPGDPSNEVAWEFAIAGFVGEMLSNLSDSFVYAYSPVDERGWFMFTIKTESVVALAELLLRASSAFGNKELWEPNEFYDEVMDFINENNDNDVTCQELINIADHYFLKASEE
jgi:hypothetical protein